jgi:signal transduction histidine kinase
MASAGSSQGRITNELDLLTAVSQMLTLLDHDELLARVIELTSKALGAERASLLVNPEYNEALASIFLRYSAQEGGVERSEPEQSIHFARRVLDQGLAGWVVRNRQPALVTDTETDARWVTFPDSTSGARSAVCVPFQYNDAVLGALTLLHSQPNHFAEHDVAVLMIIANQATVAIRNAQLVSQLRDERSQLEAVMDAMPDVLLVLDERGHIVRVNEAALYLLQEQENPGGVVGQSLERFIGRDKALAQVHELLAEPIRAGAMWSFEARSETMRRDYLVTVAVWQSAHSGVAGYVVMMNDVTTLRDLNRFKDEMLNMASHDLRSPLALIVGYCSLIALDTPADSPIHDYLDVIQRSTERMRGLLDDLLRVEQIRSSPLEMNRSVDFGELVTTSIAHSQPLAASKQQTLQAHVHFPRLPDIVLNPMLIREAMENLIGNAIKYTPEGGVIEVSASLAHGRVHFRVKDNGIGIPPEAIPRLFEAFYRVKRVGAEKTDGRGLGLNLVKTIIERHGGEVTVESEEGKGSTFGFSLPIASDTR